jgi:hypothetical protein
MDRRSSGALARIGNDDPDPNASTRRALNLVPRVSEVRDVDRPAPIVIRLAIRSVYGRLVWRWDWSAAPWARTHVGVQRTVHLTLAHTTVPVLTDCWPWMAQVLVDAWNHERAARPDGATLPDLRVERW